MKKPKSAIRKNRGEFEHRICVTLTPEQQRVGNLVLKRTKFNNLSHAVGAFIAYACNQLLPPHERMEFEDFCKFVFHPRNLRLIAKMKPEQEGQ